MERTALSEKKNHYPWLDAMRLIASAVVLLAHSRNDFFLSWYALPDSLRNVFTFLLYAVGRMGHEAVVVFFVLSGFLVLGRGLERIHNNTFDEKNYAVDRAVRIGVPLVCAIAFHAGVCLVVGQRFDWVMALGNLFSLQGVLVDPLVSPFWSLGYEVWFYILLWAFALLMKGKKSGFALFLLTLLVLTRRNMYYFYIWLIGGLAYLCRPRRGSRVMAALSFVLVLLSIAALQILYRGADMIELNISGSRGLYDFFMAVAVSLFVQQVVNLEPKRPFAVRAERTMSNMAKVTYTLYLCHRMMFILLFRFWFDFGSYVPDGRGLGLYLLFLALTVGGCLVVYLLGERNTEKVRVFVKEKLGLDRRAKAS